MPKHIGIVACSAEGAALCYRTICLEASARMGEYMHPEISMHSHPLARYMTSIRNGDWGEVARLMLSSVHKLAAGGADFTISPDNTIHQAFDLVIAESPLPWLHIAQVVSAEAKSQGYSRLAITGTKYLMTGPVYPQALAGFGLAHEIPDEADREMITNIIMKELVNGVISEPSRQRFNEVVLKLKNLSCDAVVLGCTELPLLVDPRDCPLPTLDSTRLLARAALEQAMKEA